MNIWLHIYKCELDDLVLMFSLDSGSGLKMPAGIYPFGLGCLLHLKFLHLTGIFNILYINSNYLHFETMEILICSTIHYTCYTCISLKNIKETKKWINIFLNKIFKFKKIYFLIRKLYSCDYLWFIVYFYQGQILFVIIDD